MEQQPNGSVHHETILAPPSSLQKLAKEDHLALENLYLKAENLRLQQERLKADFIRGGEMLKALQAETAVLHQTLSEKYAIDITTARVAPDGTLSPAGFDLPGT